MKIVEKSVFRMVAKVCIDSTDGLIYLCHFPGVGIGFLSEYRDVPADAQEAGTTTYYAGKCSWNPLKSYYILYPGGTLRMLLASGHNDGGKAKYFFRLKNKVTR